MADNEINMENTQDDFNSVLGVFGTNKGYYTDGRRNVTEISSSPNAVLSIFDKGKRDNNDVGKNQVGVTDELFSSFIKESANVYDDIVESELEPVDLEDSNGVFGEADFEDYEYERIFSRFSDLATDKKKTSSVSSSSKEKVEFKQGDVTTKEELRRANQEAIRDFGNRFNDTTRRKMYAETERQSKMKSQSDETVDAILRDYYGGTNDYSIHEFGSSYGSINEQDSKLRDYIRWFLSERNLYMFDSEISINDFALYIFDKLKNENRELYHSLMKSLINFDFDYRKVYDRSLVAFVFSKIDLDLFSKIKFKENYFYFFDYCSDFLRRREEYRNLSDDKTVLNDIVFKSSHNLADYLVSNNCKFEEVKNGRYDKIINNWILKDTLYWKSVRVSSRNKKNIVNEKEKDTDIKLTIDNFLKKRVNKRRFLATLALLLVLSNLPVVGDILAAPYNIVTDTIPEMIETIKDRNDKVTLKLFDDFEYRTIESSEDDSFSDTYTHLIHVFPEYMEYDFYLRDNYEQLCLFETFKSIKGDSLELMDSIVSIMCSYYQQRGESDILAKIYNKAAIDENSSLTYPVYVYRVMKDAGFDVLKYSNAVMNYSKFSYDEISKEHRKLIDEMMDEYADYCKQLEDKFLSLHEVKEVIESKGVVMHGRS